MDQFESIVVSDSSIPALTLTVILMTVLPVGLCIYWWLKHKGKTNISYLIAGILGFLVSARVLELAVHYFCIVQDNPISRFINGSTLAYVIYGITMAGVFEECGRHIILKYILKKNRTRENAVLYGIGHGGIEVFLITLPSMARCLVIAVLFEAGDVKTALSTLNITEDAAAAVLPTVLAAANFTYDAAVLNVLERVLTMCIHIGLTVVVFYGIVKGKKWCLPLAILLHMIVDTFAALYQRGAVSLVICEIWIAVWTTVIVAVAVKLYGKIKAPSEPADGSTAA